MRTLHVWFFVLLLVALSLAPAAVGAETLPRPGAVPWSGLLMLALLTAAMWGAWRAAPRARRSRA